VEALDVKLNEDEIKQIESKYQPHPVVGILNAARNQMFKGFVAASLAAYLKETGKKEDNQEKENMSGWMEVAIKVIGLKISNTDMVKKLKLMVLSMKESTKKGKNMVKESSNGLMELIMTVNGKIIIFTDKVTLSGAMAEFTMENGNSTRWTVKESSLGLMVKDMKVHSKKTRRAAMECSKTPTRLNIKEIGSMASNMEKAPLSIRKAGKNMLNGKTESLLNGWMR